MPTSPSPNLPSSEYPKLVKDVFAQSIPRLEIELEKVPSSSAGTADLSITALAAKSISVPTIRRPEYPNSFPPLQVAKVKRLLDVHYPLHQPRNARIFKCDLILPVNNIISLIPIYFTKSYDLPIQAQFFELKDEVKDRLLPLVAKLLLNPMVDPGDILLYRTDDESDGPRKWEGEKKKKKNRGVKDRLKNQKKVKVVEVQGNDDGKGGKGSELAVAGAWLEKLDIDDDVGKSKSDGTESGNKDDAEKKTGKRATGDNKKGKKGKGKGGKKKYISQKPNFRKKTYKVKDENSQDEDASDGNEHAAHVEGKDNEAADGNAIKEE